MVTLPPRTSVVRGPILPPNPAYNQRVEFTGTVQATELANGVSGFTLCAADKQSRFFPNDTLGAAQKAFLRAYVNQTVRVEGIGGYNVNEISLPHFRVA